MAIANEHITADAVQATEYPELAERYQVMAVPKIVVNERTEFLGALPERQFVGEVMRAVEQKPAG